MHFTIRWQHCKQPLQLLDRYTSPYSFSVQVRCPLPCSCKPTHPLSQSRQHPCIVAELCNSQMCIHCLYILICMYYVSIQGHVCVRVCVHCSSSKCSWKKNKRKWSVYSGAKKNWLSMWFSHKTHLNGVITDPSYACIYSRWICVYVF